MSPGDRIQRPLPQDLTKRDSNEEFDRFTKKYVAFDFWHWLSTIISHATIVNVYVIVIFFYR